MSLKTVPLRGTSSHPLSVLRIIGNSGKLLCCGFTVLSQKVSICLPVLPNVSRIAAWNKKNEQKNEGGGNCALDQGFSRLQ